MFRSTSTHIPVTKEVANYLQHQSLTIHKNKENSKNRSITIQENPYDTMMLLRFKKLSGQTLILEISDSTGKIRNIAIPQTKLNAYPLLLTTTTTPVLIGSALSKSKNDRNEDEWATALSILAIGYDVASAAIIKGLYPHAKYQVAPGFQIDKLSAVTILDTNGNRVFEVPTPLNPKPSIYLDANYQKHPQVYLGASMGGILQHEDFSDHPSSTLTNSPWYNLTFDIQTNANFKWGLHYSAHISKSSEANITSLQMGYIQPLKTGSLNYGIGLGIGFFERLKGDNLQQISTIWNSRKITGDSSVLIDFVFLPNTKHYYVPVTGYIGYSAPLNKIIDFTASVQGTSVGSFSDFTTTERLIYTEDVAPGVTAERSLQTKDDFRTTFRTQNMVFQFNVGLKMHFYR